ncbi:hypothetical protein [Pseudoalteromonas sp. T1lg75]|uniref:hypothetical protein n=1 Tax=Pseudoalteromonas sp. T1lg75 TaxID=2077102 RepID=UPI000CF73442|nr:hypothetical protein [Pseudoalteromonas sp. T1lg75]
MSELHPVILRLNELAIDTISPQSVHVKLSDEVRVAPLNIGIIAYKSFEKHVVSDGFFGNKNVYVPVSSEVLPGRIKFLEGLFDYLYISPNRENTKSIKLQRALYFTEWFNKNGHAYFMESKVNAIKAYVFWTREIERQMKSGGLKWSRKTASSLQATLLGLFELRFKGDIRFDLQQAIYSFKTLRAVKEVRSPKEAGEVLKALVDIAEGLTNLVAGEMFFPFKMEFLGREYFIFPNDKGYVKTKHTKFLIDSYDYELGVVIAPERVKSVPLKVRKVQLWTIKDALINMRRNNENMLSHVRLRFADLACCCYLEAFLILTGISRTELIKIENVDSISSKKSEYSNEFKTIKFRAKGKPTSYRLHKEGVKVLERYLTLRNWLVKMMPKNELKHLFIRVVTPSGKFSSTPPFLRELIADDIGRVYKRLRGKFFPEGMKALTPQEIRRIKTVVLHEKGVPSKVVADSLNHSEKMNLNTYTNTKTSAQAEEMVTFWRSVKEATKQIKVVQIEDVKTPIGAGADVPISTGHCSDFNNPVDSELTPLIKADCKTQYGCLYCANYCCHADETDIHKLLSLAFVVSSLKSKGLYLEAHYDHISKLHIRVNAILTHVKSSSSFALETYEKLYKKVWELGELTPFWELRLRRYESMGVMF